MLLAVAVLIGLAVWSEARKARDADVARRKAAIVNLIEEAVGSNGEVGPLAKGEGNSDEVVIPVIQPKDAREDVARGKKTRPRRNFEQGLADTKAELAELDSWITRINERPSQADPADTARMYERRRELRKVLAVLEKTQRFLEAQDKAGEETPG